MQLFFLFLCALFSVLKTKRTFPRDELLYVPKVKCHPLEEGPWEQTSYLEAFLKSLSVENLASSITSSTIVGFSLRAKWGEKEVSPSCWQRIASHLLHACGCCQDFLFSSRGS